METSKWTHWSYHLPFHSFGPGKYLVYCSSRHISLIQECPSKSVFGVLLKIERISKCKTQSCWASTVGRTSFPEVYAVH